MFSASSLEAWKLTRQSLRKLQKSTIEIAYMSEVSLVEARTTLIILLLMVPDSQKTNKLSIRLRQTRQLLIKHLQRI